MIDFFRQNCEAAISGAFPGLVHKFFICIAGGGVVYYIGICIFWCFAPFLSAERNQTMGLIQKIFGTYSQRELKSIYPIADKIEALEDEYRQLTDEQLQAKTPEFKQRLQQGETLDDILPEAFAGCWACGPTGCSSSAALSCIRDASPR